MTPSAPQGKSPARSPADDAFYTKPHLRALTGLRAYAALWVALSHFYLVLSYEHAVTFDNLLSRFALAGYLGVDLFFVLAGYIHAYNFKDRLANDFRPRTVTKFYIHRIARVGPAFWFCCAVQAVLLCYVYERVQATPGALWFNGLLVGTMSHVWFAQAMSDMTSLTWMQVNGAFWSVSAEWFAYLLFPLLVLLTRRWTLVTSFLLAVALLVGLGYVAGSVRGGLGDCIYGYTAFLRVMAGFVVGYVAFHLRERSGLIRRAAPLLFGLSIVGTLLLTFAATKNPAATITIWSAWETPYIALLGLLVISLHSDGWHCRAFTPRPIVYLGEVSYALYLVHYVAFSLLIAAFFGGADWKAWLSGDLSVLPILALSMAVAVAISAGVYHLVEQPGRRVLRRLAPAGTGTAATSPSTGDAVEQAEQPRRRAA
jgi:peptidoglycan/LPS O-acetylase OafA/YrhL